MWPAVMLGALPVALSTGLPLWAAVLTALGNAAGPALAAESLRRHGLHTNLDRRQDLWRFGLGAGAATLISATHGTCWLVLSGALPWTLAPAAWASWWLGDLMGVIVVGVPLLTASRATLRRAFGDWRWVPGLLLAGGSVAGAWFSFRGQPGVVSPLLFLPYLLLGWLALRSGVFAASATVLFDETNVLDFHRLFDGFCHVVHGEGGDGDGCEGFHFDAGFAGHFGSGGDDHAGERVVKCEIHIHFGERERMT